MKRIGMIAAAAALLTVTASAAEKPNTEKCDHKGWGYLVFSDHHFGTTNVCAKTISVWFMDKSGSVVHADVKPGEVFDTGLGPSQFDESAGWAAASCPLGYAPSPAVSLDDWDTILDSKYRCLKK
jgi:hypothetical protein